MKTTISEERIAFTFRLPACLRMAINLRLATSDYKNKQDIVADILMEAFAHELEVLKRVVSEVEDTN